MGRECYSNQKYMGIAILLSDIREFSPEGLNRTARYNHFGKNNSLQEYLSFMNLYRYITVNLNLHRKSLIEFQGVIGYPIK